VAAIAVVVGTAVWVMTPHVDDSAFARQQAVAALLPKDRPLHTKARVTVAATGTNGDSIMEDWTDAGRKAARTEWRSAEDGTLSELDVRVGDTVRALAHDRDTGKWTTWQYDAPVEFTSPGGDSVDQLREGLETGEATVVDRITVGGEEYWVVERTNVHKRDKDTGSLTETTRATMAVDDYALRELVLDRRGVHPVDGPFREKVTLRFSVWETVPRESLPEGFLTLQAVDEAAPAGTVEQR
jgi:hypothetical protein